MVLVLPDQSGLQQGIMQAGSSFGGALNQALSSRQKAKAEQSYGTALQEVFSELGDNPTPQEYQSVLAQAMQRGVPFKNALEFGTLYSTLKRAEPKSFLQGKSPEEIAGVFEKFGMDSDTAQRNAELYSSLTTGGQTKFGEMLIDDIRRGSFKGYNSAPGLVRKPAQRPMMEEGEEVDLSIEPNAKGADVEAEEMQWEWPEINPFEGMTPREAVNFRGKLYKENSPHYKDLVDKLRAKKVENRDLKQLDRINNSGKLPKGIGKAINVDWKEGKLRVPAFANPETQLFVKTVNGFIRNAKDNFGARVTNFDLQTFLQTLPTLANTEEGRRLILDQMKTGNELMQLDYDSEREVLEQYGLDKIDAASVNALARDLKKDKEAKLEEQFSRAIDAHTNHQFRKSTPSGRVPMFGPNGERVFILEEQVEVAKQKGFKEL